ncbi:MAG TPA: phosphatase PAP2 family protein [Candidatus Dormibacteraeota bacterium]|nr:phosphatase PAP2 family protein [Candidatus Dormibacteraeota bacterium]
MKTKLLMADTLALTSKRLTRRDLLRLGMAGTAIGLASGFALEEARPVHAADSPGKEPCGQVEPGAGAWKTWVISSGSAIKVPPPPGQAATRAEIKQLIALAGARDAATLDQIDFWNAGSPSYRWVDYAVPYIIGPATPLGRRGPDGSRQLALVMVAIYDAIIATWHWKYAHNRPRPSRLSSELKTAVATPESPSYPSEHAAAGRAAAEVLGYLYPADAASFIKRAEDAAHSRVAAGVQYPSDVAAGLELGRMVGAAVVEHGKHDRHDLAWDGVIPAGPGLWTGTNPITPVAGKWQPWVLGSGADLRPGPPPVFGSTAFTADLQEVITFTPSFAQKAKAFFAQTDDGVTLTWYADAAKRLFEERLADNPPRAARAYALMSVAEFDSLVATWDAKYAYWRIRPSQASPGFTTLFTTPNHPSYPAAHGGGSGAYGAMLAYLFPRDAASINNLADDLGMSRLWAGIHYRTDIVVGLKLGRDVAAAVIKRASDDGSGPVPTLASVACDSNSD